MKIRMGILTLLASFALSMPVAHAKNLDTIGFEYKSAAISSNAQTKLQALALDLKHLKDITVTAYVASNAGDPAENQSFATQRVAAVKSFLVQQGVADSAIVTQTLPGPASKARLVEVNYGSAPVATASAPAATSTPVKTSPAPVASTPPPVAAPVAEKVAPPPAPVKKAAPPPPVYPQTTEEYSDLAIPAYMKKAAAKPVATSTPPPAVTTSTPPPAAPPPAPVKATKAVPPPITTPPPATTAAASTPPPPVATPAAPVITAQPEKKSGIQEVDISTQPYSGGGDTQPNRWDY